MISIAAIYVALVIPFGLGPSQPVTLDFGIHSRIGLDLVHSGGVATPLGYLFDLHSAARNPSLHAEELLHIEQWEALGPAFAVAYLLTGGDPFEPYNPLRWQAFPAAERRGGREPSALAYMWQPDVRRSPQWRLTFAGEGMRVEFLPAFGELFEAARRAAVGGVAGAARRHLPFGRGRTGALR